MKCSKCGSNQLIVSNTRNFDWGIKRIRICLDCGKHIPTIEINKLTDEAIMALEKTKHIIKQRQRKE